jgi:translation elongation factor P/translation initiation factor 5A
MAVNVTDLKRGDILEIDGDPWRLTEVVSQTPSARGASLLVKAKLTNLRTGQGLSKTWRGGDTVAQAEVEYRPVQFLYRQGEDFTFMDLESYDQFTLDTERVADGAGRHRPGPAQARHHRDRSAGDGALLHRVGRADSCRHARRPLRGARQVRHAAGAVRPALG